MTVHPGRLHPTRGWWAKFDWAEQHLVKLQGQAAPYCATRKHPVTKAIESKNRPREWVYRVNFTRQPDQSWCLLVGDFLFNLNCALDHLAVALNPVKRKNDLIYFPLYFEDPWRRQEGTRRYVERDPTNRQRFTDSTCHMRPEAIALIRESQPYAQAKALGKDPNDHVMVLLSRFHVTDKHRRLLAIGHGGNGGRLTWTNPRNGQAVTEFYAVPPGRLAQDGAVIKRMNLKVDMEFMGSLSVAFARNQPQRSKLGVGPMFALDDLVRMSSAVKDRLLALESYIQW